MLDGRQILLLGASIPYEVYKAKNMTQSQNSQRMEQPTPDQQRSTQGRCVWNSPSAGLSFLHRLEASPWFFLNILFLNPGLYLQEY